MHLLTRRYLRVNTIHCVCRYFLHNGQYLCFKIIFFVFEGAKIILKLRVGQLIVRLMLTIIEVLLLNSIISEMYFRIKILQIKLVRRCANVPLIIPVGTSYPMQICYEHVVPDIKFPIVVKKRPVNIHLYYISPSLRF